jgi:hypothetical protein
MCCKFHTGLLSSAAAVAAVDVAAATTAAVDVAVVDSSDVAVNGASGSLNCAGAACLQCVGMHAA